MKNNIFKFLRTLFCLVRVKRVKSILFRNAILAILFISLLYIPSDANAQKVWKGFMFSPVATTNNSHSIFMEDFRELASVLKNKGINTIVFDMNNQGFHFTCDKRLNTFPYSKSRGFTTSEARQMAKIARDNGMQVIVAMQVLSHSMGYTFAKAYPEYMLPVSEWKPSKLYDNKLDYIEYRGKVYKAIKKHTSDAKNAPPSKSFWQEAPSSPTRDPYSREGEALTFKMIDELIQGFTVAGIAPEGFHIGSDELRYWYEQPQTTKGASSAQIFARVITDAYKHIKSNTPQIEVIMWGDMLDDQWNGASKSKRRSGQDTAAAIDLIPKDIIIADWRYEAHRSYGYDSANSNFPSVGKFLDKGFRVWPTSWSDVKGTTELIMTGNREQVRTGRVIGHLYSTWLDAIVPELAPLLSNPERQLSDEIVSGFSDKKKQAFSSYYRGLADSINATVNLVGKQH